jgi:hypothetical protein
VGEAPTLIITTASILTQHKTLLLATCMNAA